MWIPPRQLRLSKEDTANLDAAENEDAAAIGWLIAAFVPKLLGSMARPSQTLILPRNCRASAVCMDSGSLLAPSQADLCRTMPDPKTRTHHEIGLIFPDSFEVYRGMGRQSRRARIGEWSPKRREPRE